MRRSESGLYAGEWAKVLAGIENDLSIGGQIAASASDPGWKFGRCQDIESDLNQGPVVQESKRFVVAHPRGLTAGEDEGFC